jgi:hypothetical protein
LKLPNYKFLFIVITLINAKVFAQAPAISYSTPQTYTVGTAITTLSPYNTGGVVSPVNFPTRTALTGTTFSGPSGMAIDASGNLYITNYNGNNIRKYSSAGAYLGTFGSGYDAPVGIVFDSFGNAYVLNTSVTANQGKLLKFNSAGVLQATILTGLGHPLGINIDAANNIYITDRNLSTSANSVTKYSTDGTLLLTLPTANLNYPDGVVVDNSNNIYVLNRLGNNVTKYNSSGTYLGVFASGFSGPLAMSIDLASNLYVGDSGNSRIQVFNLSGTLLTTVSGITDPEGTISDGQGSMYASSYSGNAVYKYVPTGGYSISSPLPAGLTFSTINGQISGTPTITSPAKTYTITAYNNSGSTNTTVTIGVVSATPTVPVDINAATNTVAENSAVGTVVNLTAYSSVPGSTGSNLALNKPVTVSSLEGVPPGALPGQFPAVNAVDGNTTTRWSSVAADPQYITVDLGSIYDIDRVKITWESAYAIDYQIQISTDGTNFTTIRSITGNGTTVNDNTNLSGLTSRGRYVRIYGTKRATNFGYSIFELEVYRSDITYSLTDDAGGRFAIDPITGIVTVNSATLLDFETNTTHNITVRAANTGATLTSTQTFAIAVTNVNEAPVITSNGGDITAAISVVENTYTVTTVTATDVDAGSTQTYSISGGADASKFSINSTTGAVRFITAPNFSTPASAAGTNVYLVNVTVSDGTLTDVQNIAVTVTNTAFLSGYGYRKPITLNNNLLGITTDQTNFPVLLSITDNAIKITGACTDKVQYPNGNAPGYDFAFTSGVGGSEIPYQVESYDQTNGVLLVWVKLTTLRASLNNTLYFYFGASTLPTAHNAAFYNSTWPSDYQAVYHFNETTYTGSVTDATTNAHTGTTAGMSSTDLVAGKIGNAYTFNGSTKKITANAVTVTGPFTLSAWVRLSATSVDQKILTNQLSTGGASGGYKIGVYSDNTPEVESGAANNRGATPAPTAFTTGTWYYVQGVYNGTTISNYVNGVQYKTVNTTTNPSSTGPLYIGVGEGGSSWFFNGLIDEPRVSNIAKSADWLKAEYVNQNAPATYTNFSAAVQTNASAASLLPGAVFTWTGAGGTDPVSAANWTNTTTGVNNQAPIFTGNETLVIPAGLSSYPILTADITVYGLNIAAGANIDLNGKTLIVGCNIYNSGRINAAGVTNASTITWAGKTAAQTYTGTNAVNTAQVGTMTINNTAAGTVTITGGPVDIYTTLNITSGNLVINNAGNGALTLKSLPAHTANVPAIPSPFTVTGIVKAERFVQGNNSIVYRGWRLMSSPVSTGGLINLDYLAGGAIVTGATTSNGTVGGNPTIYLYNETRPVNRLSFVGGNFIGVTNTLSTTLGTLSGTTAGTTTLPSGNGYFMFFRGNKTTNLSNKTVVPFAPADDVTFTASGTLNQGNIVVRDWHNQGSTSLAFSNPTASVKGFNLVGNPYASSIDWDKYYTAPSAMPQTNLSNTIYIYNAKLKIYSTYMAGNGGIGTNAAGNTSNIIPSGQGFFVRANTTNATLTFTESAKVSTQVPQANLLLSTGGATNADPLAYLRVHLEKDSVNSDESLIFFKGTAKPNYFINEDAEYLKGSGPLSLSTMSGDNIALAINQTSYPAKAGLLIPLNVGVSTGGLYQFNFNDAKNIPNRYEIYLIDSYKKDSLDINNKTYNFNVDIKDTTSFGAKRFKLVIKQKASMALRLLDFSAAKVTAGAQLSWITENESNYTNFTVERSTDGGKTFDVVGGMLSSNLGNYILIDKAPVTGLNQYRLKQDDINGTITYSKVVKLMYSNAEPSIIVKTLNIYPNPATSVINVGIISQDDKPATYSIRITNGIGMQIKSATFTQNTWQGNISSLVPGTYVIQVTNNSTKAIVGIGKFVKH